MKRSESESHSVMSNSLRPHRLYNSWNSPGQNTGVDSFSLLQGIFPTQGLNPGLLHCRTDSLPAEPQEKPKNTGVGSLFLLLESSWPRNRTGVSCIAGGFFTNWALREAVLYVGVGYVYQDHLRGLKSTSLFEILKNSIPLWPQLLEKPEDQKSSTFRNQSKWTKRGRGERAAAVLNKSKEMNHQRDGKRTRRVPWKLKNFSRKSIVSNALPINPKIVAWTFFFFLHFIPCAYVTSKLKFCVLVFKIFTFKFVPPTTHTLPAHLWV